MSNDKKFSDYKPADVEYETYKPLTFPELENEKPYFIMRNWETHPITKDEHDEELKELQEQFPDHLIEWFGKGWIITSPDVLKKFKFTDDNDEHSKAT